SQIAKSTTRKFGCADSFGTSSFSGTADAAYFANSGVRVASRIVFAARVTSSVKSCVKKTGVSEIRKSAGHFSVPFTQRTRAAYFSDVKAALNRERSCESTVSIARGYSPFDCESMMLLRYKGVRIAVASSSVNMTTRWPRGEILA